MPDKNSKSQIQSAIDKNPCGRCRAAGYPSCKCGGRSGSGEGGGESENKDTDHTWSQSSGILNQIEMKATIKKFDAAKTDFVQSQLFSNTTVNYETKLISIESDRLRGNLTLQIKTGLSIAEIEIAREFLSAIKIEFDEFKNQLVEKGVSINNLIVTLKNDELSIHIPNPKYYDAFIKHLERKYLLPIPNPEQQHKVESSKSRKNDNQKDFHPTPLSTRLEKK